MSAHKLTARWTGPLPSPGQFLKAPRGRTAYEFVSARPIMSRRKGRRFVFTVVRHPASCVPEGATVHDWFWDKRERRRR